MKKLVSSRFLAVVLLLTPLKALADSQYYRALADNHEARPERDWLTSFKADLMGGMANSARNGSKNSCNPLQIFGANKIGLLAEDASGNPSTNIQNADLAALLLLAPSANITYSGKFNFVEFHLNAQQNFVHGFFGELDLPVKNLNVHNVTWADTTTGPDDNTVQWETVKNSLSSILSSFSLTAGDYKKTGIGDIVLNLGWTHNNDDISALDFFDTTFRVGVSIPSAAKKNQDQAFSIPLGYDGHIGIPVAFDFGLGFYDWVTWGVHVDAIFFIKKTIDGLRMQTNTAQNGYIKLLKGTAKRELGHIFNAGSFLKLDHVFKGFSASVGYNYIHKDKDYLTPSDLTTFTVATANSDALLLGWNMHAIHAVIEYDFSREGKECNPTVSLYYARPVAGKRIFQTNTIGGDLGLNLAWNF